MPRSSVRSGAPGRRARRALLVVAALVAGVLLVVPPVSAAGGGITFDEGVVADGGRIDNQYRFVGGADGLRFGSTLDLGWTTETDCGGSGVGDYRPTLRQLTGNGAFSFYAHSGARVAESVSNNCAAGEFGTGAILMRCTVQCLWVNGYIGMGNQTNTPPTPSPGTTYTASGYAADGTLLQSVDVLLDSPGALNGFTLDPPGDAAMTFVKLRSSGSGNSVIADDVSYAPDPAALPAFSLSSTSLFPDADLSPSAQTVKTYAVVRSNGSDGTLTPQLTGLPDGVSATFSPASFPGTSDGPLSVTLTADPGATASGATSVSLALTGPPTAGTGAAHDFVVHLDPTLDNPATLVNPHAPSCTRQARQVSLFVRNGLSYTGPVVVTASVGDPGWSAGVVTSPVPMVGGVATATIVYSHDSTNLPFSTTLTVTAHPQGRPNDAASTTTTLIGDLPTLSTTPVTAVPPLGDHQTASTVSLTGTGFCPTSFLRFGNDKSLVTPTVSQPPDGQLGSSGATNTQTITAAVPRLATSGTLGFQAGFGWNQGPVLTTTGYRNTAGFAFDNYPVGDLVYQDMTDAFGEDQTYLHIDLCFPFGCTITMRDPVAMVYTAIVRSMTVGTTGSGHCYGMSLTAALMRQGGLDETSYPPFTAGDAWHLQGSPGPSPQLARTIQANHLKQFGLTFLHYWLTQHISNAVASGNDIVTQVREAIDTKGGALITIADHGGGHVVLAHSVEDVGPGEHWIDLYDPNYPYLATEDSDHTGVTHETRLGGSRIHVVGNTWTLVFPDQTVWSGDTRGLAGGSIIVVPLSEAKKKQLLPSLVSIPQLLDQIIGFGSTGSGTTVTAGPDVVSYGAINQSPSAGLFLVTPTAKARGAKAVDRSVTVESTSADTVTGFAVSDGTVVAGTVDAAASSSFQADVVTGGLSLTPDSSSPLQLQVARQVKGSPVRTTIAGTAPAGGTLAVQQSASRLTVSSTKAVTLQLAVDASAPDDPAATRTVSVRVPGGDDLTIGTAQLVAGSSTMTVRIGGVTHTLATTTARLGKVSITGLAAARGKGSTTVTAKVRVSGRTGTGTVVMTLADKRGRVVAHKTLSVKSGAVRAGRLVTYRWRAAVGGRLTAHVAASLAPTIGTTGLVSAARSVRAR